MILSLSFKIRICFSQSRIKGHFIGRSLLQNAKLPLNPFSTSVPLPPPWKHQKRACRSRTLVENGLGSFPNVFRGYRIGRLVENRIMYLWYTVIRKNFTVIDQNKCINDLQEYFTKNSFSLRFRSFLKPVWWNHMFCEIIVFYKILILSDFKNFFTIRFSQVIREKMKDG